MKQGYAASVVFFFIHSKTLHEGCRKGAGGVAEEVLELEHLPFFGRYIKGEWQQPATKLSNS